MSLSLKTQARAIDIDEYLSHARQVVWKALTESDLIRRWMMPPEGSSPLLETVLRSPPNRQANGTAQLFAKFSN
jgi:uncharacterized protein YndB with AHSA1/START domain